MTNSYFQLWQKKIIELIDFITENSIFSFFYLTDHDDHLIKNIENNFLQLQPPLSGLPIFLCIFILLFYKAILWNLQALVIQFQV